MRKVLQLCVVYMGGVQIKTKIDKGFSVQKVKGTLGFFLMKVQCVFCTLNFVLMLTKKVNILHALGRKKNSQQQKNQSYMLSFIRHIGLQK